MTHERIDINPNVMVGKPVIKGTRITVELIVRQLSAGISVAEIIEGYPHINAEDIDAARAYAAEGHYLGPYHMRTMDFSNPLPSWIGECCTAVVRDPYSWRFGFGSAGGITVGCPWRILEHGRIVLCAADDGQKFGLPEPVDAKAVAETLLLNKPIRTVSIAETTADMRVEFHDKTILELLNNSSGYEAWQAYAGNMQIIGMGGGELAILRG